MPVETRTLLFDQDELKTALLDHVVRKRIASEADRLLRLDIGAESSGVIILNLLDGLESARSVKLTYADAIEALIRFCRDHQIPLPRYGDKRLTPAGDGMALIVRMVFSRPSDRA